LIFGIDDFDARCTESGKQTIQILSSGTDFSGQKVTYVLIQEVPFFLPDID
jgi:hypothetical protein